MDLVGIARRQIHRDGVVAVLRRINGTIATDVSIICRVRGYEAHELVGLIRQGSRELICNNDEIAAAKWPGPPLVNDTIILPGKTIVRISNVDTAWIGTDIVKFIMTVVG